MDITETVKSLDSRIASLEVEMKLHRESLARLIKQADDKPEYNFDKFAQGAREYAEKNDTHRTVTLRIPKGMTVGRTILEAMGSSQSSVLSKSDTDLQKALDEVEHE